MEWANPIKSLDWDWNQPLPLDKTSLDGISTLSKALFCWVRGLVCTNELYSYAGDSTAADRATHAGQVSREVPD
jgi:hypothetical protein